MTEPRTDPRPAHQFTDTDRMGWLVRHAVRIVWDIDGDEYETDADRESIDEELRLEAIADEP